MKLFSSSALSSFFGKPADAPAGSSPVDAIIYIASLASKPREIDPILDKLRLVTSRHGKGEVLTSQDHAELAETYTRLEDYLVSKDPLRTFTKDELRQKMRTRFKVDDPQQRAFWERVGL